MRTFPLKGINDELKDLCSINVQCEFYSFIFTDYNLWPLSAQNNWYDTLEGGSAQRKIYVDAGQDKHRNARAHKRMFRVGLQHKIQVFVYPHMAHDLDCRAQVIGIEPDRILCSASLTFNNPTFCPHSVFMCFVWI